MIDWYLETEKGDADLVQIVELKEFRTYSVGRKRNFDIISLNPLVSRTHGLFKHKTNNRIYVHDSNSSNGIWVNDEKITPAEDFLLNENDLIGIGSPSSAQEARLELFRLRGTHLTTVDIKEIKLKKENTHNETEPPTVSIVDSSSDNDKLATKSAKVCKNATAQDTNSTNGCRNASPKSLAQVKTANNVKDDRKQPVEITHETPTHSENNCEHVFSFPEDESEHVIPKFQRSSKNSHKILDAEPNEKQILKDKCVNSKSVVSSKELLPVVRLDRLELPSKQHQTVQAAVTPKKKLEVISSSSSDEQDDDVDKTTKQNGYGKLSSKSPKKTSSLSAKHRDSSDKESSESSVHSTHSRTSSEKEKRTASLFEELFGDSDATDCKERKLSSTSSSSIEISRVKLVEKSAGKERKLSSTSSSSIEISRVKLVEKSAGKERKSSSTSSSSIEISREKLVEKSAGKERKLSSTSSSSSSNEKLISFVTAASRLKSARNFTSKIFSSSSDDEPIDRENSREEQSGTSAGSRISDSSDYSDKSSRSVKSKKSSAHSTEKRAGLEEIQPKTETDSKTSDACRENEDLFAEEGLLKSVKSECILPTAQDFREASTSKSIPSVEEVRTIKREIFDEREIDASRQSSPIMCASHVSISSESDTSSPSPQQLEVPNEGNGSFSISCDIGEIICLSDDDDIFPKSQMFEDDVAVKDEPDNGPEEIAVKSEQLSQHKECPEQCPTPENDDNIFGIIKKDVESDDDAILIDDDENDEVDSLWYSRLSQPGFSSSQVEEPQEEFDVKNVISIRTGPVAVDFLDDTDLIICDQYDDFYKESLSSPRSVDLRQDEAELKDDSVPVWTIIHRQDPLSTRPAIVEPAADELDTTSKLDEQDATSKVDEPETTSKVDEPETTSKIDELDTTSKVDEPDTTSKLDEIKSKIATKKSFALPPVIDAPHLIKGRRKTTEEIKPKGLNKRGRKRKQSVDERATTAVQQQQPVRTFGTGTNLDKSVANELHKRHKRRRPSPDPLPKDQQQELREKRKKELKKLAQKPTEDKKQDDKPKKTTKPYIKVSSSRGSFLAAKETEKRKLRVKSLSELEPKPKKKFVIPKKKPEENGNTVEEAITLAVPSTSKDNMALTHQILNKVLAEDNQNATTKKSVKKRVTFNDTPQIRVYVIDEGNHMNKCTSKDAPLPRKGIQTTVPATRIADDLPENVALCDILSWVPIWLEEQKNISAAPKLSLHKPIQMLHTFNTHGDYCNIVIPLLLLELWRSVFRDWINSRKPIMLACIDDVQSMHICRMNMLSIHCHSDITRHDSDRFLHPMRGDLLVIEILLGDTNRQCAVIKKLGYVVDIRKRRLNANDLVNSKLVHTAVLPEFLVEYKIMLKDFNTEINRDRLIRIRTVSRIGTSLRFFKSVSLLNQSALCKFILHPQVNDYKVPKLTKTKLVIHDKLDADQVKCMIEACQICVRPEPGIYMVQGPPGTGKSRLIKNIVHQLIYGERKPGTKPNCILLCAPSNGAIDQLALKLLEMRQSLPQDKRFGMVRLGPPNSIHPKVKRVSLPCLVEAYVQKQLNFNRESNDAVLDDLHFRQSKINMLENKLVSLRERKLNTKDLEIQLEKAKNDLELFHSRSKKELTYHERKALERTSEETVITKADIVCSTLSSCVASRMEEMHHRNLLHFTCCIIDEATQSSEQETLIPLTLGIKKLILVGDPAQLPATVLSQEAKELGYGNSLFYRIQKCFEHLPDNPIRMLKTQYRMHPDICKFPNEHFYYGKLITSSAFIDNRHATAGTGCTLSHRYRVFALRTPAQPAYCNVPEAQFVLALSKLVLARTEYSVGIITPYTKQREYLQRGLDELTKDMPNDRVTVNTVDGFQGQERDVIIMSCVRHNSNVFLADQQRLNVSLTRAKHALYICANVELFKNDDIWTKLEQDAMNRHCLKYLTKAESENENYVTSLLYNS